MRGIGGNIEGIIQISTTERNDIGEQVKTWKTAQTIRGWLDLATGNSGYTAFYAKVQESTHVFMADYVALDPRIEAENSRMLVNGKVYDIMLIDNPMEMKGRSQWEIYLKYTGGR